MALVTHHPAHREALRACHVGERAGVFGCAAAPRKSDVDVDQDLFDAALGCGLDGLLRVDRHGDPAVDPAEPGGIDDLVGEQ